MNFCEVEIRRWFAHGHRSAIEFVLEIRYGKLINEISFHHYDVQPFAKLANCIETPREPELALLVIESQITDNRAACSIANNKENTIAPHYWPFVRGIHWWSVDSLQRSIKTKDVSKAWCHLEFVFCIAVMKLDPRIFRNSSNYQLPCGRLLLDDGKVNKKSRTWSPKGECHLMPLNER